MIFGTVDHRLEDDLPSHSIFDEFQVDLFSPAHRGLPALRLMFDP